MELSAVGRAGCEQVVRDKAEANSEAVASTTLSSLRRLIGALENLGRDACATFSTIGARGPQFAYSSSGDEALPAQGFFPGIREVQIRKTEEEGGEVQEHRLPVLPEEQNRRLNRQAHGAHQAVVRAGDLRSGIALRGGPDEVRRGDGSIYDQVLEGVSAKWATVGDAAEARGASPDVADAEANKAIGKSDPQANFSADAAAIDTSNPSKVRRLATRLRPSGLHSASSEAGTTPLLQFPTPRAPRFA